MTILETIAPLPAEIAFWLGRIYTAHDHRAHYRAKAKKLTAELKSAKRDLNTFGMYDDCGPSYEASYSEAKGAHSSALALKISSERYYKKLKHEFLEAHPEHCATLEALFPGSTPHSAA